MVQPRIVLLIFVSGKVVLTGGPENKMLFVNLQYVIIAELWINLITGTGTVFSNDLVSVAGAKERSEIYEAFENIYPILRGFKKV